MRFFHTGEEGKKGGTTVGYEWLDKDAGTMLVTFARCSEHDNSTDTFSKKKGRLICEGRAKLGIKLKEVQKPENMDRYEFLLRLVRENDQVAKEAYGTRKPARRIAEAQA